MKPSELSTKPAKDLKAQVAKLRAQLDDLYIQRRTKEIKKTQQFSNLRKEIARHLSAIREQELRKEEASDG